MFFCWHYEIDTLPRFQKAEDQEGQSHHLYLPVGVWAEPRQAFNIILEIWINDNPSFRIGFDDTNPNGFVRGITRDAIAARRYRDPKTARWYLEIEEKLQSSNNEYYEAVVKNVPVGSTVRYNFRILPLNQVSQSLGPYTIQAIVPSFVYENIFAISDGGDERDDAFSLYHKEDAQFYHFRVDLIDITTTRLNFQLEVHGQRYFLTDEPFRPDLLPSLPNINPFSDYLTISIPKHTVAAISKIRWRGIEYDINNKVNVGRARIMFIHYCMQGLNDLFELPNKNYNPPRSFIQVTMRDEKASYSSRPNSKEGQVGDGYLYTLDSHRNYNIPYLWTFNGGVLGLIAHDCPNDLKKIKKDVSNGIMDPTIAGFGGHRLPYYQEETNNYSIQYGIDMVRNIVEKCNNVYYLDQRLYKQTPNVINALKKGNINYIVVDGSTGFWPYRSSIQQNKNGEGAYLDDHYLWKDRSSGIYILYITDELREKMMSSSEWEMKRGKLARDLKKKFFHFASNPIVRRNHLMIYSDDADKASGNGWFDGNYSGFEIQYKAKFDAALEWIAEHLWIASVTSADLDTARDCVGTINMQTAICPSVDPGGVSSLDKYNKEIHFDAWYDNWKNFHSFWLNQSMEEISQSMEYAIIDWPKEYRNRLYSLAQMTFSMYLHESQWNKQPLESIGGLNANQRRDVFEPEDFVIAATLQLRNAQVYLNASVWADWALNEDNDITYLNDGPIINLIQSIQYESYTDRDERYKGKLILRDPLQWDRDVLQNVILYNRQVLIVMDRNGGRITHLFTIQKNIPRCVSGTFKCYQFLTGEKVTGENITCDGEVFQNTVYTPNHAYIASDVKQSRGIIGKKYNPKTGVEKDLDCYYPDNFNAYGYNRVDEKTVEWFYEKTESAPAFNIDQFRSLLKQDREAKLRGETGVVFHPHPAFRKQITLSGRTVNIQYFDTTPDHVVANEFTIDLYDSIMFGKRNHRKLLNNNLIEISNDDGVSIRLELGSNCIFSQDTLDAQSNMRLHRVMTDCLELTTPNGGGFSYSIQL